MACVPSCGGELARTRWRPYASPRRTGNAPCVRYRRRLSSRSARRCSPTIASATRRSYRFSYAGLRPGEALALTWRDVGQRTILVERAAALGEIKETKTRQTRSVRLLAPLARDLREWRLKCGRPDDEALVFPRFDGATWNERIGVTGASGSSLLRRAPRVSTSSGPTTCATRSCRSSSRRGGP